MLSLRFTSLVSFFVSGFYELGLVTLETKMPSAQGGQHFFAERVGLISLIPLGGIQQRNAVASFHFAIVISCSSLIRARTGGINFIDPFGGGQQRNAVASFHFAIVIFCSMLIRAALLTPETRNAISPLG